MLPLTPAPAGLLLLAAAGYPLGLLAARRRGRGWPAHRTLCWYAGLTAAAIAVAGPVAAAAHHDFTAHVAGHLLLGMAAPLLLVRAGPGTLALRALPPAAARKLSHALGARPVRLLTHPVTAGLLDAGGLWLLYTTTLYSAMAGRPWLHTVVQAHMFAAGYLFTAAVAGLDPAPHRAGRPTRMVVLVLFLAAHAILAKYLYVQPPPGVPDARAGAELMYYGGDLIDLILIAIVCHQWYAATDPARRRRAPDTPRPWRLPAAATAGSGGDAGGGQSRPAAGACDTRTRQERP